MTDLAAKIKILVSGGGGGVCEWGWEQGDQNAYIYVPLSKHFKWPFVYGMSHNASSWYNQTVSVSFSVISSM